MAPSEVTNKNMRKKKAFLTKIFDMLTKKMRRDK